MSILDELKITKKQLVMLAVFLLAAFVGILNQTLLSPALPSIMIYMNVDASTAQWLTTAFTLVNAIMVPITAFLIDRFSTKGLFEFSTLIFFAGTVIAAISQSFIVLLAGRILQAVGAGILMPMVQVVMLTTISRQHRGMVMGIFGLIIGFAPIIGPTAAGIIVDKLNWHALFFIVAPLMLICSVIGYFTLENVNERKDISLDKLSVVLSTLGFGGLLYGFSDIGSAGLNAVAFIVIAVGFISLFFFFTRQLKLEQPMLKVDILKNKTFLMGTIITMIVQAALMVGTVITPIYVQTIRGYSATISGMLLLPGALVTAVFSIIAGKIFDQRGPRGLAICGYALLVIGNAGFTVLNDQTSLAYLCSMFAIRSLGIALVNMPLNTWSLNALDNSIIAHGTALNNTFRQVAGSLGTAILVTVMSIATSCQAASMAEMEAMTFGINTSYMCSTVLTIIGLVLTIVYVKKPKNEVK